MDPSPHSSRRFALFLAAALFSGLGIAERGHAAEAPLMEVSAVDGGQYQDFVVSRTEVWVKTPGSTSSAQLKSKLESSVAGAKTISTRSNSAILRLSTPLDMAAAAAGTDDVSKALGDSQVSPILYVKGQLDSDSSRRIATKDVLFKVGTGNLESLKAATGAVATRSTGHSGQYAVLTYANGYKALAALSALRGLGGDVQPLLRRQQEKRALQIPGDGLFPQQWHLQNTAQSGGRLGIDANVLGAWKYTLGAGSTISIVDDCLQTTHPDLVENCPPLTSNLHFDFNDDDRDPRPQDGDAHGTSVAGVAAARQNNGIQDATTGAFLGVSGSAPNAQLIGLRLISAPTTDEEEAGALFWTPGDDTNIVQVSNNSWGPFDGAGVRGPGILTKAALREAASRGRGGKGQVTVFAAGNGNQICCDTTFSLYPDNSNFDGYANSRFVLAVASVNNEGVFAPYSEPGANILVTAPSNGGTLNVVTTDVTGVGGYNPVLVPNDVPNTDYTNSFGGTSSAAPLAAGVVALALSANVELGWRDVKEIMASTARLVDGASSGWNFRDDGFKFHHQYGGGMVDAAAAVARASIWSSLGVETAQVFTLPPAGLNGRIPDATNTIPTPTPGVLVRTFDLPAVNYPNLRLEHIELELRISHRQRSDLDIVLTSPNGTRSVLAVAHNPPIFAFTGDQNDSFVDGDDGWTFTTTHCWGENSRKPDGTGQWKVEIFDRIPGTFGSLDFAELRLYGTLATSVEQRQRIRLVQPSFSVAENTTTGTVEIPVQRVGGTEGVVAVNFSTYAVSAEGETDYTPTTGTLTFQAGVETQNISVPILNDLTPESSEVFYVLLSNPQGASLGGLTVAEVAVTDDESTDVNIIAVTRDAEETEIGIPVRNGVFRISRPAATNAPLDVSILVEGTATPGVDYLAIPSIATIPANATSVDVIVSALNDSIIEGTETVLVSIVSSVAYSVGTPANAQVNIVDNDRPKVRLEAVDTIAQEKPLIGQDTATVRITRDVALDRTLVVDLQYFGTQVNGTHYGDLNGLPLPTQVVLQPGEATKDIVLLPIDDNDYDATKSVVIQMVRSVEYEFAFAFLTSAQITILEDDPLPDSRIPTIRISSPRNGSRILRIQAEDEAVVPANPSAADLQASLTTLPALASATVTNTDGGFTIQVGSDSAFVPTNPTASQLESSLDTLDFVTNGSGDFAVTGATDLTVVQATYTKVQISGTATDASDSSNAQVRRIIYRLDGVDRVKNDFTPSPSVAWTITLPDDLGGPLAPGHHVLQVKSEDLEGNISKTATLEFDYVQVRQLALNVAPTGSGSIQATPGARDVGSIVTLTVKPAAGQVFTRWVGNVPIADPTNRTLRFEMPDFDTAITAEFATSPFVPAVAGAYQGLIETTNFAFGNVGYLKIQVNAAGTFSGQLILGQITQSLRGEFNSQGIHNSIIIPKNAPPITLSLQINVGSEGAKRLTGTLTQLATTMTVVADRNGFDRANPPPTALVQSYTFTLPVPVVVSNKPQGTGYGTVKIDTTGNVRWTAVLGDGTKTSGRVPLTSGLTWPCFSRLYGNRGVILGVVTHDSAPTTTDLTASLDWFKPNITKREAYFPLGFTVENGQLLGSIYTAPASGAPALVGFPPAQPTNAVLRATSGNLLVEIARQAIYTDDNKITIPVEAADKMTAKINPKTGQFSGSFIHPVSAKRTTFQGILIQKTGVGSALFRGTSVPGVALQTGTVVFEKQGIVAP